MLTVTVLLPGVKKDKFGAGPPPLTSKAVGYSSGITALRA